MRRTLTRHTLLVVTVAIAVVGVIGSARSGDVPGNGANWSLGVVAVGYASLGWVVAGRRRDLLIGWLLLVGGLALSAAFTADWWAIEALLVDPGSLPGGPLAAWAARSLDAVPMPLVLVAPLVLLPNGRPRSARWRSFIVVTAGAIVALTALASVAGIPAAMGHRPESLLDVPGIDKSGWSYVAVGATAVARLVGLFGALISLIGLVAARRRASGAERGAYRTVLFGAVAFGLAFVLGALVGPLSGQRHSAPEELYSIAGLCIPTAIGIAMARFRLYEVRAAVSRSVLVVGVGAVLSILYLAVLGVVAGVVDESQVVSVPSALAAGVVVLATAPIAAAGRRLTRRWFGRDAVTGVVADRFNVRVGADTDSADALRVLAETLLEELRLGSVELAVGGLKRCVVGHPDANVISVPLTYAQREIGEIIVSARAGEALAARDHRLLVDIARYVAVAVEAIRTAVDLHQARHELENAHIEERRRVRRDLHDGVGPMLASIRLQLTALRRATGDGALDDLVDQVADTIREVRRIVDGLRPSVLEDLGLLPALQILLADTRQNSPISVALDVPESMPELPAEVVNTAYRVVSEALANVMRHSNASSCAIGVRLHDGVLEIEVRDDGQGFDDNGHRGGMGLRNIATRASLADGSATVTSAPGAGTTVTLRVPA